jgi:hypothetical protein
LADAEEATITDVIWENYIIPDPLFTNEDFTTLTVDYWLMRFADDEKPPLFNCSSAFLRGSRTGTVSHGAASTTNAARQHRKKHNPDGEFGCPLSSRPSPTTTSLITTRPRGGFILTIS